MANFPETPYLILIQKKFSPNFYASIEVPKRRKIFDDNGDLILEIEFDENGNQVKRTIRTNELSNNLN